MTTTSQIAAFPPNPVIRSLHRIRLLLRIAAGLTAVLCIGGIVQGFSEKGDEMFCAAAWAGEIMALILFSSSFIFSALSELIRLAELD